MREIVTKRWVHTSLFPETLGLGQNVQIPFEHNHLSETCQSHCLTNCEKLLTTCLFNHRGFKCEALTKPLFQTCYVNLASKENFLLNVWPFYMRPWPNGGFKHPLFREICWRKFTKLCSNIISFGGKLDQTWQKNALKQRMGKDCLPSYFTTFRTLKLRGFLVLFKDFMVKLWMLILSLGCFLTGAVDKQHATLRSRDWIYAVSKNEFCSNISAESYRWKHPRNPMNPWD